MDKAVETALNGLDFVKTKFAEVQAKVCEEIRVEIDEDVYNITSVPFPGRQQISHFTKGRRAKSNGDFREGAGPAGVGLGLCRGRGQGIGWPCARRQRVS